jgi:hypothetical protein
MQKEEVSGTWWVFCIIAGFVLNKPPTPWKDKNCFHIWYALL